MMLQERRIIVSHPSILKQTGPKC